MLQARRCIANSSWAKTATPSPGGLAGHPMSRIASASGVARLPGMLSSRVSIEPVIADVRYRGKSAFFRHYSGSGGLEQMLYNDRLVEVVDLGPRGSALAMASPAGVSGNGRRGDRMSTSNP